MNIFYLLLEKLNGFAEDAKVDVSMPAAQVGEEYEAKRTDAWSQIEDLNITKRLISTCAYFLGTRRIPLDVSMITAKLVQQQRLVSGGSSPGSLNRATSTATTSSVGSRNVPPSTRSPASAYEKKSPPPPPSSIPASAPPPYSPPSAAASFAATKKAPPPPPPLKPKPKPAEPEKQYVVAVYDFEAQADGDLDFRAGDRIEVVEKTDSAEDWWTGRLDGRQGVFPGESKEIYFEVSVADELLR